MADTEALHIYKPLAPHLDNLSEVPRAPADTMEMPLISPHPTRLAMTPVTALLCLGLALWAVLSVSRIIYNVWLHPLSKYPGPIAAKASDWWKVYIELWKKESMTNVLTRLHRQYGDVVRLAPNELHFANPKAYHDIYASALRWDKEKVLYHSMGVDSTSFGYLKYPQAKQRKDVLQPLFSRRAVSNIQGLVKQKLALFCEALANNEATSTPSNIYLGLRCLTVDTISAFCFGKSLNALSIPDFRAPIVLAMDYANPEFLPFKHLPSYRSLIWTLPPWIAAKFLPDTSGFAQVSSLTSSQVDAAIEDPSSLQKYPHPTIYHRLLDPAAQDGNPIPSRDLLLEEAKNLIFAGTDTTANTLYVGMWHLMRQPKLQAQLREEIRSVCWPELTSDPTYESLSTLPLLSAIIKESLRLSSGVVSPLSRVVPSTGGKVAGHAIPGGTVVGMSAVFMHYNADIFPDPHSFNPQRWMGLNAKELERCLVPFSRGPRSCLGINLAHCELYLSFATLVRRFELSLEDGSREKLGVDAHGNLVWRDTFLPWFFGGQVHVRVKLVEK
jgi:cytochrome P450